MNPIVLAPIAGQSSYRTIDQVDSHLNTSDSHGATNQDAGARRHTSLIRLLFIHRRQRLRHGCAGTFIHHR